MYHYMFTTVERRARATRYVLATRQETLGHPALLSQHRTNEKNIYESYNRLL